MILGKRRDKPAWRRRWKSSTSMRENRESLCLPVRLITGRAVQGTPRR